MSSDSVKYRDKERLPKTDFKPTYPLNRASITPGGHETHYDDTPGKRRIRVAHASGSYTEIGDDGRQTTVTVGNQHNYAKQGITLTIDQNNDVKIGGHNTLKVDGGAHIETKGQTNIVMGAGKHSVTGAGDIRVGAKNIEIVAQNELNLVGKDINIDSVNGGTVTVRGKTVRLLGYKDLIMNSMGTTSMHSEEETKIGAQKITASSKSDILLLGGDSSNKGIKIEGASAVVLSQRTWVGMPNINTKLGAAAPPHHSP